MLAALTPMVACAAVYPELGTPLRPASDAKPLDPPPPDELVYLEFKTAVIPATTRDGRKWDALGGDRPDPFAKLLLDDKELIRTPVQSNTLNPNWPDQARANYAIARRSEIIVQLWDNNALHDRPICHRRIEQLHEQRQHGQIEVQCESGARVTLVVRPARARLGLGFHYELRTNEVRVTRTVQHSPAARAGLRSGDRIVKIQGKDVAQMEDGEAKSLINVHSRTGLRLRVSHPDGKVDDVTLAEGPIYPLPGEDVSVAP
jgi:hypothetical protein